MNPLISLFATAYIVLAPVESLRVTNRVTVAPGNSNVSELLAPLPEPKVRLRKSIERRSFVPPSDWEAAYYELMRGLDRDTVRTGLLGRHFAAPKFRDIRFYLADSIPNDGRSGWAPNNLLSGLTLWTEGTTIIFRTEDVFVDSIPAILAMHEMAHAIRGRPAPTAPIHPLWLFVAVQQRADKRKLSGLGAN